TRVWLSAQTGNGVELLREVVARFCRPDIFRGELSLPPTAGWLRSRLYDLGAVKDEAYGMQGECRLTVEVSEHDLARLVESAGAAMDQHGCVEFVQHLR